MSNLVIVVNPTAGGGRAASVWESLRNRHPSLATARMVCTPQLDEARRALADHIAHGADRIIVLGGDGSMHLLANFLLGAGHASRVACGLVPAGTGSDFARTLGLPRDPGKALDRVIAATPRAIDAIELQTDDGRRRFVINVASAGMGGMVDEAVNALPNRGATAYLGATLSAFRRFQPVSCRATVDGEVWHEGPITTLAIGNGRCFGRGMQITPRAELDDGEADIVVVGAAPKWKLLLQMPQLYSGTHIDNPKVKWRRGKEIRFEPLEPMPPFDLDGDVFPSCPATFRVLPGVLNVLA